MTEREQRIIQEACENIIAKISANIESTGLKATGDTQRSLRYELHDDGGTVFGRSFFQGLEQGRPAGAVPGNFVDIIKRWIVAKGLTPTLRPYLTDRPHKYTVEERSLNIMAWAVAEKIRREGFKPWRNGGYVEPPQEDVYTPVLAEAVVSLKSKLIVEIKSLLN